MEPGHDQAGREARLGRCRAWLSPEDGWSQELVSKEEPKPCSASNVLQKRGHLKFKINSSYRDSGKCAKINTNTVSHSSWQVTLPTNAPTCAPPSAIFWLTQLFLCNMTLAAADYTSSRFSTAILVPLGLFLKNENVALVCFLHQ